MKIFSFLLLLLAPAVVGGGTAGRPFVVRVMDRATRCGVPLVELRTVHQQKYFTDNAGVVAIDEPELMGQSVFFHVASHGYEFPKDGFGYRGRKIAVKPGEEITLVIDRVNIAERLYRITGAGGYDHSVRAGLETPVEKPLLNSKVFGCDSVLTAIFDGKLFWIWGDTNRPAYPLGNFHATGAVSDLPSKGGIDPATGIELQYFQNADGFVKPMAKMPGEGPTWLSGLTVLPDESGADHLVAFYVKVKPPLTVYERGLCEWDREREEFVHVRTLPLEGGLVPVGHPFEREVDGEPFVFYADPLPTMRIPKRYGAWKDPANWQAVETRADFRAAETGSPVKAHRGSIAWSDFRNRWIMIFTETGGSSYLGEVWYAEADAPEGPWETCVKVVTHDQYSFYNPKQHPYFADSEGKFLFFEGTYTAMFSGNPDKTPKYDYNQILYRLDLADERLRAANNEQ